MTRRIHAFDLTRLLSKAGHTHADSGTEWVPGFRVAQASPRTSRVHHDGPDEVAHLHQYAAVLRAAGYTVTPERPARKRPRLRVTHP